MKSSTFYVVGGAILALTLCHAVWRGIPGNIDPKEYVYMPQEMRESEYRELEKEAESSGRVSPRVYMETLARFDLLEQATERARLEGEQAGPLVSFIQNTYIHRAQSKFTPTDTMEVRNLARIWKFPKKPQGRDDPLQVISWVAAYVVGILFVFGHFVIQIEEMGGRWWATAAAEPRRFLGWLLIWPLGIFNYPTEIDVKHQLVLAYRRARQFASVMLGMTITCWAAGCGAKRVKTEPDDVRVDTTKSWRIDLDTITWPSYIGMNTAVFHPAPVQQSSAVLSAPKGTYAGIWHSAPLGGRVLSPNFGWEIDAFGGWNGKFLGTLVNGEVMWIAVTPLADYSGDVLQFTASAAREVKVGGHPVVPYFQTEAFRPSRGADPEGGFFFHQGVRTAWKLGRFNGAVSVELLQDTGAFGFDPALLAKARASAGVELPGGFRMEIPIRWSKPLNKVSDGRAPEFQAGFRLSFSH